ncbi:hypothetical protein [Agrobacterium cavarae]|uniref:hypothetical protein n=1 Tax=Agrobacterium cavarae TaxID=2528239 RepID=UPI003D04E82D
MLILKFTLVPLFLLIISMSGKWWGPTVAGWLSGLPVVAGPILFLLAATHGHKFGVQAATLSLSAILASEAFNFAYAWSCRSVDWPLCVAKGLGAWLIAAIALAMLPTTPVYAMIAAIFAVAFGQTFLPRSAPIMARSAVLTRTNLAGRMIAGAALTVFITALSSLLGAKWSGLLAVFPLLGIILAASSHRLHGPEFVISLLRGMVLGRFSFAAFCLCLIFALPKQTIGVAFAEASALAIVIQGVTMRLTRDTREIRR